MQQQVFPDSSSSISIYMAAPYNAGCCFGTVVLNLRIRGSNNHNIQEWSRMMSWWRIRDCPSWSFMMARWWHRPCQSLDTLDLPTEVRTFRDCIRVLMILMPVSPLMNFRSGLQISSMDIPSYPQGSQDMIRDRLWPRNTWKALGPKLFNS